MTPPLQRGEGGGGVQRPLTAVGGHHSGGLPLQGAQRSSGLGNEAHKIGQAEADDEKGQRIGPIC